MTKEIIIDGVNVAGCKYLNKVVNEEPYCNIDEEHLYTCSSDENCYYKELRHLQRENKEKIDIIEQMIKILYPNANDDELYDVTFNGEYIDELKELKDTADTMLMANDIKKLDIDSLREANERLEQENKELKEKYSHVLELAKTNADSNEYCLQELEKENFALTQESQQKSQTICELEQENKEEKKAYNECMHYLACMTEQRNKLKTALEEIRELVEKSIEISYNLEVNSMLYDIKHKIDEVLND